MRTRSGAERKRNEAPRYGSPTLIENPTLVPACAGFGAAVKANDASAATIMRIRFMSNSSWFWFDLESLPEPSGLPARIPLDPGDASRIVVATDLPHLVKSVRGPHSGAPNVRRHNLLGCPTSVRGPCACRRGRTSSHLESRADCRGGRPTCRLSDHDCGGT